MKLTSEKSTFVPHGNGTRVSKRPLLGLALLLLLFCLTGCQKAEDTQAETYGIQPPIDGLSFGMSKEEVSKLLGDNYTTELSEDGTEVLHYENLEVFGKTASAEIRLMENPADGRLFPNLGAQLVDAVNLSFDAADTEQVLAEIKKQYGDTKQKVWNMENSLAYSSEDCVNTLTNDAWIQGLWEYEAVTVYGEEPTGEIPDSFFGEPLNSLAVIYTEEGCGVQITGGKLVKLADLQAHSF